MQCTLGELYSTFMSVTSTALEKQKQRTNVIVYIIRTTLHLEKKTFAYPLKFFHWLSCGVYSKARKLLNTYWSWQVFGSIQRVYRTNFTQILRVTLYAIRSVPISRENAYELHHVCRSVHLFVLSAQLPFQEFSWNLILRTCMRRYRENPNVLKIGQKYWTLYMTTKACFIVAADKFSIQWLCSCEMTSCFSIIRRNL